MTSFREHYVQQTAFKWLEKGRNTGYVSRILSYISLNLLVLNLALLFNAEHFIPLAVLMVVGFTSWGHFATIGIFIYSIFIGFWPSVIVSAIFFITGWISSQAGMRNVKKVLYGGKSNVEAFEGTPDLLIYTILQLVCFGLALITSGLFSIILWILCAIFTLLQLQKILFRVGAKWRTIHFPCMIRYSNFIGFEIGQSQSENRETEPINAFENLIMSVWETMLPMEVKSCLESIMDKMENFVDKDNLKIYISKKYNSHDEEKLKIVTDEMIRMIEKKEIGLQVRYIIAEIVENDYGINERTKYLYNVFIGKAT
ncbi:MAG: hypothetical protein UZ05_CHB002001824 [Chlorobi bacterium OLB5]|nr:MAG: hypothetical protein UZ05_CHB002001824 [Chlorobi bacterium OLB5]